MNKFSTLTSAKSSAGKKGQVVHLFTFGLAIVIVATSFIFLAFFVQQISDAISGVEQIDAVHSDALAQNADDIPAVMDAAYGFFIIGSALVLIVAAFLANTSPIFFFITLPIFLFVALGNAVFANVIDEIGSSTAFASTYAGFGMMQFFTEHWVAYIVLIGGISTVAYFGGKVVR